MVHIMDIKEEDKILTALHINDSDSTIARQVKNVHTFFQTALANVPPKHKNQGYRTLATIASSTRHITRGEWLGVINDNLPAPINAQTKFCLIEPKLIWVVDQFMKEYRDNPVPFARWMTVLVHYYFASASSYPLQTTFRIFIPKCLNYMEYLAPHALNALLTEYIVSTDHVETTKHMFRSMKQVFPKFLNWTKSDQKNRTLKSIKNLTAVFGVPRRFYSHAVMNEEYRFLPIFRKPFVENLLRAFQGKAETEFFNYAYTKVPQVMFQELSHILYPSQVPNAHYYRNVHSIYIPSVMMSPFTVVDESLAASYGLAGSVVAHEIGHSFDPIAAGQSSNLMPSRSPRVPRWEGYQKRLDCIVRLYDALGVRSGTRNYSMATRTENFADISGLEMVQAALATDACVGLDANSPIAGLTNKQLFYVARCFLWCTSRVRAADTRPSNPHIANLHRCNTVLGQSPDFRNTFNCPNATSCPILT
ncbi:neprilysin-1-like [Ixodes scapularis]|uniref:neprilysin-1-like n=1 Tax=Ixodes scapularis TaxID=6945 RepID=UPI001C38F656|nr:neprilysin-1-like [Ixodes scapularis]